jgi:hypothetical protein
MGLLNIGLIGVGIALVVLGYLRARGPWARYQGLQAQQANIARYQSWRGGLRDDGPTGADEMMALLRGQAMTGFAIAGLGILLVVAAFFVS